MTKERLTMTQLRALKSFTAGRRLTDGRLDRSCCDTLEGLGLLKALGPSVNDERPYKITDEGRAELARLHQKDLANARLKETE